MKKVTSWKFHVLCMLGLLCSTAACSDDDPNEPIEPEKPDVPEEVTFQVTLADATSNSASVNIVPSSDDATYFASIAESAEISALGDEELVAKYVAAEDFSTSLHRGPFALNETSLRSETMYTVVVFSFDKGVAGKVNKLEFKTGKQEETGEKIELSNIKVGFTDISLRVTPNSLGTPWYYVVMEKEYYQKYLDTEGVNGPITRAYYVLNNKGVDNSLEIGDYLKLVSMIGTRDIVVKDLKQNKEYVLMVFYVNPMENNPTVIYDYYYAKAEFTTLEADPSKASEVEILSTEVTHDNGKATITVTARASNPAKGKFRLSYRRDFEGWDITDPKLAYTIATMMGKALSKDQLAALQTAEGCKFSWTLNEADAQEKMLFGLYVENEEGAGEAKAIEIDPTK